MNEFFAAHPSACEDSRDLKELLSYFGPYAGRYIARYPDDWRGKIRKHIENWDDLEKHRARQLIQRARERGIVLPYPSLDWTDNSSWTSNAKRLLRSNAGIFDGIITPRGESRGDNQFMSTIDEIDIPHTADEFIHASPEEYLRVCNSLIRMSPEIVLVDPYLNPFMQSVAPVLKILFSNLDEGKCERIKLWGRHKEIIGGRSACGSTKELERRLKELFQNKKNRNPIEVEFILVDDDGSPERLHDRYLFSIKGGINLSQGFQKLRTGQRVGVSPIGEGIHKDLISIFIEENNELNIVAPRILFTV